MNTTTDQLPIPHGSASAQAAALYAEALERMHGARGGAAALLARAVDADPGFALAHAARWLVADAAGDATLARAARAATLRACERADEPQRSHCEALGALIERRPDARECATSHLGRHPRDVLVVSQLAGELFFHGGAGKRRAALELFEWLAPHHGDDDWAFRVRLGFHLSEAGDSAAAMAHLEAALATRPDAPYVAHAMAHGLLEGGDREGSARFLSRWVAHHDVDGSLDGHIHWHVALGELEAGDPEAALARYRSAVAPGRSQCPAGLTLADAGGLLLRLVLEGRGAEALPRDGLSSLLDSLRGALGAPFVGVHAAALLAALDERAALSDCVEAIARETAAEQRPVAERAARGLLAFAQEDYDAAVAALGADRAQLWEPLGGSNEERALLGRVYEHARARASGAGSAGPAAAR